MKKLITVILTLTIVISLAACNSINNDTGTDDDVSPSTTGGNTATEPDIEESTDSPSSTETPTEAPTETPAATPDSSTEPTDNSTKVLVAYFSATGNTKRVAEYAAEAMNADLYEIVPAVPYTSDDLSYSNDDCRANREMNDENCRPEISGSVENMADYGIVFIGYPIWWGEAPKIVSSFVESYDFSGKTVVTFCTSGSSGLNDSSIKKLASGANWISGKRLNSNSSQSDIAEWIDGLNLDLEE